MARRHSMKSKSKKKIRMLVISDLHCGHLAGLTPPDQWIHGTSFYEQQKKTWNFYINTIKELQPIDILICNGDAIDGKGTKSGGTELITSDRNLQSQMAIECLKQVKAPSNILTYGCLTAGHRILTADLRYIPVENLKVGDKLLAFDENRDQNTRRRYWKESIVEKNEPKLADNVYKLYLSDNTTIEATGDHPFL